MAHKHNVYDTDNHFSIDPITRTIKNETPNKISIVQYDHASERFTFELPRYIEEHDMSLCNRVQVHYINKSSSGSGSFSNTYEVDDFQISPDSDDVVICSWLLYKEATQYAGPLTFSLQFNCLTEDTIDYQWATTTFSGISVISRIYNEEYIPSDDYKDLDSRLRDLETHEIVQTTGDSETAVMSQKAVTDYVSEFAKKVNLFNKDDTRILDENIYIAANGALVQSMSAYAVTHPIKVAAGQTYTTTFRVADLGSNKYCRLENENGEFIGAVLGTCPNDGLSATFTITQDCYARFNMAVIRASNPMESFMVVEGDTLPDNYISYGTIMLHGYNIGDVKDLETEEKSNLVGAINENKRRIDTIKDSDGQNPLLGKKLSVNGDSICYGAGYVGGYAKIIGENNSMIVENIGVGGGTITPNQLHVSSGTYRHSICATIENMDEAADYAIIEGGVNDSALKVPLGSITADFVSELDETTFYGAFESMLKKLIIRFAGKKYGYIAVHQMDSNYRVVKEVEGSYFWAAKKCCEKWGVPFLDLNSTVPPFGYFTESTGETLYSLRTTYTNNGDGWHPNEEGYKKYYVPKIEAWLKTI